MRLLSLLVLTLASLQAATPRSECFPVDRLSPELRPKAEALLLQMLDREALYTLLGGIKPMSSGFVPVQIALNKPDTAVVDENRLLLQHLSCGNEVLATMTHFATTFDNKRYVDGVVVNIPRFREAVRAKADFFAPWGISPQAHPVEALMAVEYERTPARLVGYGYLFGYPDYAVDFFGDAAWHELKTRKFKERDFIQIPTFAKPTGYFVYAVPKGHTRDAVDEALAARAAEVLEAYKTLRDRYVGEGKPGAAALLRDQYCDTSGACSIERANNFGRK